MAQSSQVQDHKVSVQPMYSCCQVFLIIPLQLISSESRAKPFLGMAEEETKVVTNKHSSFSSQWGFMPHKSQAAGRKKSKGLTQNQRPLGPKISSPAITSESQGPYRAGLRYLK